MALSLLHAGPAQAEAPVRTDTLANVVKSIPWLTGQGGDEFDTFWLQADVACQSTLVASLAKDQEALAILKPFLQLLAARAAGYDDPFSRDMCRAYWCLAVASAGDPDQAERKAKAIPTQTYAASALGMLAGERARAGDLAGFERLSKLSIDTLGNTLMADNLRFADDKEYPSWVAWSFMDDWLNSVFYAGRYDPTQMAGKLQGLGESLVALPLEPGAKAEVIAAIASGFAAMGDEASARQWLAQVQEPLEQEAKRMKAAENDEFAWFYGTDAARIDLVRAYLLLGDTAAANKQVALMEDRMKKRWADGLMAVMHTARDEPAKAKPMLDRVEADLMRAIFAVRLAEAQGEQAGDRGGEQGLEDRARAQIPQEPYFLDYEPFSLFWDLTYLGEYMMRSDKGDRVDAIVEAVDLDLAKVSLRLGALYAEHRVDPFRLRE